MAVSQQVNLPLVCDKYYQMHFFNGIVDLCLSAAQKLDPDNRAKSYVDNGKPPTDTRGKSLVIYVCISTYGINFIVDNLIFVIFASFPQINFTKTISYYSRELCY